MADFLLSPRKRLWRHRNRKVRRFKHVASNATKTEVQDSSNHQSDNYRQIYVNRVANPICCRPTHCAPVLVLEAIRSRGCGGSAAFQLCATICKGLSHRANQDQGRIKCAHRTPVLRPMQVEDWGLDDTQAAQDTRDLSRYAGFKTNLRPCCFHPATRCLDVLPSHSTESNYLFLPQAQVAAPGSAN